MAELRPSFGGITRIRFKGSSDFFFGPLSHYGSPALRFQNKTRVREVKDISHNGHEGHKGTQLPNDVVSFVDLV
jgi:hypothetical protein